MKKTLFQSVILSVTCLLLTSSLLAQSPQGIPYQAVMRNADGSVMASSAVSLTFMIHDGTANGVVVYQESHNLTSNSQGLVSCVVGNGVVLQGNFSSINWGNGAKFLHVMMGSVDLGTQQMLSVPYALHSSSADSAVNAANATNATNAVNAQTAANGFSSVSQSGDTLYMANGTFIIVPGISAANFPPATDIDGNTYTSIIINGQEWMQQNLAVTKYRNGDPIPTDLDDATWSFATSGAYAIYNNDAANNTLYGKLYNWYVVNDSRGLCPTGWHVPSDAEWTTLENSLGGSSVAGGKMKATTGWNSPNTGASNESGFTGLTGGVRDSGGTYNYIGYAGYWWSSTENDSSFAWDRGLYYNVSGVSRDLNGKHCGFSVRCLRD